MPGFREICLEKHGFNFKTFDTYVNEITAMFNETLSNSENDNFINCCSSISGFAEVIPERLPEFKDLIIPLINVIKEKTDLIRKNAAVCLAKICKNEENAVIMR